MGRDWYALRLQDALGMPYAGAKRVGDAAKAARAAFQTELGAIVTSCELHRHDREVAGALTRRELDPIGADLGRAGRRRTDLIDALLPYEVPSSVWLLRIEEFVRELDHLDDIVEDIATTGDEHADELLPAALEQATMLSSEQRRWLSAIRDTLLVDREERDNWWWAFDPRQDLLEPARLMVSYDLRLRPILGERLTWP